MFNVAFHILSLPCRPDFHSSTNIFHHFISLSKDCNFLRVNVENWKSICNDSQVNDGLFGLFVWYTSRSKPLFTHFTMPKNLQKAYWINSVGSRQKSTKQSHIKNICKMKYASSHWLMSEWDSNTISERTWMIEIRTKNMPQNQQKDSQNGDTVGISDRQAWKSCVYPHHYVCVWNKCLVTKWNSLFLSLLLYGFCGLWSNVNNMVFAVTIIDHKKIIYIYISYNFISSVGELYASANYVRWSILSLSLELNDNKMR